MRRRYTVAITDEEMAAWLDEQVNISEYLRKLVQQDMGLDHTEPTRADVFNAILEELRALRQDLGGRAVVTIPEASTSTRRSAPAGLSRQADKFREGKRGE